MVLSSEDNSSLAQIARSSGNFAVAQLKLGPAANAVEIAAAEQINAQAKIVERTIGALLPQVNIN
jgi:hypothetical protein